MPGDLQTMEFVCVRPGSTGTRPDRGRGHRVERQLRRRAGRRSAAIPSFEGHLPQLGTDFAGVVTAVGPDVTEHRVGDHVGGMSPNGCWSTFVTCDARLTATLPAGLTDGSGRRGDHRARHRLVRPARPGQDHVGGQGADPLGHRRRRAGGDRDRPRRGCRDLRHGGQSAASTVVARHGNRARLRFAQHRVRRADPQATPTATASTSCSTRCRVPRSRAGLELLSFGGRFVEIGKRDIYGDTRLGLFPFRRNLTFYAVDLGADDASPTPTRSSELLTTVYRTHGGRHAADAAEHALPDRRCRGRRPAGRRRRAHRQGGARRPARPARTVAVVPPAQARVFRPRRLLHRHRRPRRPRALPRRGDGGGGLRPHRAQLAVGAERRGAGGHRPHPRHRRRHRQVELRRHRRRRRRPSGWWRRRRRPGFRCAACCTPRRWSRTPR